MEGIQLTKRLWNSESMSRGTSPNLLEAMHQSECLQQWQMHSAVLNLPHKTEPKPEKRYSAKAYLCLVKKYRLLGSVIIHRNCCQARISADNTSTLISGEVFQAVKKILKKEGGAVNLLSLLSVWSIYIVWSKYKQIHQKKQYPKAIYHLI